MNLKESVSRKLHFAGPKDTLDHAFCVMRDNNIRHLPVFEVGGLLVGIISDRDLQRAMMSTVKTDGKYREETMEFPAGSLVEHYMNWPVQAIDVNATISEVAQLMIKNKISAVVVTNKDNIIGIVTHEDLLRLLCEYSEGQKETLLDRIKNMVYDPNVNFMAQTVADTGL